MYKSNILVSLGCECYECIGQHWDLSHTMTIPYILWRARLTLPQLKQVQCWPVFFLLMVCQSVYTQLRLYICLVHVTKGLTARVSWQPGAKAASRRPRPRWHATRHFVLMLEITPLEHKYCYCCIRVATQMLTKFESVHF